VPELEVPEPDVPEPDVLSDLALELLVSDELDSFVVLDEESELPLSPLFFGALL
jgi:hypothetical protein